MKMIQGHILQVFSRDNIMIIMDAYTKSKDNFEIIHKYNYITHP